MARSDSEMISKSPITVKLGEAEYKIPTLTILPSREWRVKLNDSLAGIADNFRVDPTQDAQTISRGLAGALIQFPEQLAELVFLYREYGAAWETLLREKVSVAELGARFSAAIAAGLPEASDFPRATVLSVASEEQLAKAFSAIMEVAYPFLPQLALVTQVLKSSRSQVATVKYSN